MPIYEFKCQDCNLLFEKFFSRVSEELTSECPTCQGVSTKQVSLVNHKMADSTRNIPKEIDHKVGADAEQRWSEYETVQKTKKEQIRQDTGSHALSRDENGNYSPLQVTKDGQTVSAAEGLQVRKELYREYNKVIHDPETKKAESKDE